MPGISSSVWEDTALFEYEGRREIKRIQAKYDLKRTPTWTSFREPLVLKYLEDSTSTLLTGFSYYWDDDGRMVVRSRLHDQGTYQQGDRMFLRNFAQHLHCFVDVEANLGIYTLLAARHTSKDGKVFAFEASRIEFDKLKLTLAWNKLHSVIAENLAVGSHNGRL